MESIAGDIRKAKAKAKERSLTEPWPFVDAQVPDRRSILNPHETLVRHAEREHYERILGSLSLDDPTLETLVDLIDFGHRGTELEEQLGVEECELATLRRRLKRRAQRIELHPLR